MATQIGELRARLTAEATQMKREVREVKGLLLELGQSGKKVEGSFDGLNEALSNIGLNAQQIKKINDQIRSTNPEILEKQLKAVRDQLKGLGLDAKQIDKIEKEMNESAKATERAKGSMQGFGSAIAAVGAGAALAHLVTTIGSLADEAQRLAMAYQGLSAVSKALNVDTEESIGLAEELSDRWGLSRTELANAVKTYLTAGLSLEQTKNLLIATADAAVYNRQAHLSWGEAINQVAQGIKSGNSELTDAAGITTNLSVMYERYAKTIGKSAATLTEAEKIQAAYNGMLQEGALFAGNADEAMTGYTGTQATFTKTLETARIEMGEAFLPVLQDLMELVTPIIKDFSTWAENNKEVVAGLAAAAVAVTALIAVVGALAAAFLVLNAAMGPIGWAVLGIGALVAGTAAYTVAAHSASDSILDFASNQERLNDALAKSPLSRTANDVKALQDSIDNINTALEKRVEIEEEIARVTAERDQARANNDNAALLKLEKQLSSLKDDLQEVDGILADFGVDTPEDAAKRIEELNQKINESAGGLIELERQKMRNVIADVKSLEQMKALVAEYDSLNKREELTTEQKSRLEQVTKSLKEQYPDLLVQLDEENRWHIKNKDALDQYITGEENRVAAAGEASVRVLEIAKKEAEERVRLAQENLAELERIEKGGSQPTAIGNALPDSVKSMLAIGAKSALNATKQDLTNAINQGRFDINDAAKAITDITGKDWDSFLGTGSGDTDSGGGGTKKTLAQIQQEDYQNALKLIQYKKDLNQLSEKDELDRLQKLSEKYKDNADIRMDLEVKIFRLQEQMRKTSFSASQEWIEQEERRMTLAGKTEEEITQMKLDAWTRVRNRFEKDTEFYKQADTQIYNLKISLIKAAQQAQEDATKEQEKQTKDLLKTTTDAIDKAKKKELDALDERRKAIQKFYDDQAEAIDNSERLKERNELIAEAEKYRFATSEEGQKTFQELQEQLREMDVEDQKQNLEKQRDQQLDTLDRQKDDIESWYDDLRSATSDFTGDMTTLYQLADDERLKSFVQTNDKIKAEMAQFKSDMAAITAAASATSILTELINMAQLQANAAAWGSASPSEKARLSADSKTLGESMGWHREESTGIWYKPDGTRAFHTGGIAGQGNFRNADDLMPDEINAVLEAGEVTLTEKQVGILVSAVSGSGKPPVVIEKLVGVEMHDTVIEDEIDMNAVGRNGADAASDILRRQITGSD